jgi:DNA polymerase-3 subunit epsilon
LCRSLSIDLKNAHRAKADAKATTHILDLLLEKSDGNLEPYMYSHQKKVNRSLIPDEMVEKLPVKAGVLYFLDGEQNVVYLVKSKNIRKKAWSIISRMNNKRYADIASVSEGIDYYVTGSPLLASIRENEEIASIQPRYNRKYKVFETRYSIYERIDKNGYLTFEAGMYNKESKGIINFAGQSEAKLVLEQNIKNFNLRTPIHTDIQLMEVGRCKIFFNSPVFIKGKGFPKGASANQIGLLVSVSGEYGHSHGSHVGFRRRADVIVPKGWG